MTSTVHCFQEGTNLKSNRMLLYRSLIIIMIIIAAMLLLVVFFLLLLFFFLCVYIVVLQVIFIDGKIKNNVESLCHVIACGARVHILN